MTATEPLFDDRLYMHRCRDCGTTWNGILAPWRTDSQHTVCNHCQATYDDAEDALERYLWGSEDDSTDDGQPDPLPWDDQEYTDDQ